MAGRVRRGLGAGRGGHRRRPPDRASARAAGLVDWHRVEEIAIARLRNAPGHADRRRAARDRGRLRRRDGAASCRRWPRTSARSCRASSTGSRSSTAAAWVQANTAAFAGTHRQARGRLLEQMLPEGAGFAQGADDAGQPLGHDPPARAAARVHGPARARPVRPRAAVRRDRRPAGCCSSRRTSARPRGRWTCRSGRSGPGSRSTRRPTRSSSRRIRGSGRTSRSGWSGSSSLFSRRTRRRWAGRRCGRSGPRSAARAGADDQHWMERLMSDEQRQLFRETQAVMSLLEGFGDHVMDEVGKELVPGRRADLGAVPRPARSSARRSSGRCCGSPGMDLKMEQYRKGEAFVAEIERLAGAAALRRLWDGPETLPTARGDRATRRVGPAAWASTAPGRDGVTGTGGDAGAAARAGLRARRRARGDRADPDPRRALPVARPRGDPRGRAGRAARDDRLRRPPRRAARRRRGDAPRPPARPRRSTGSSPARRSCAGSTRRRPASSAS